LATPPKNIHARTAYFVSYSTTRGESEGRIGEFTHTGDTKEEKIIIIYWEK